MPLTVHGSENVSTSSTNSSTTPVCLKAAIVVVAILRGSQKVDTRAEVSNLDRAPMNGPGLCAAQVLSAFIFVNTMPRCSQLWLWSPFSQRALRALVQCIKSSGILLVGGRAAGLEVSWRRRESAAAVMVFLFGATLRTLRAEIGHQGKVS